ncbi:MAG: DUF2167 domain-containing protein [Deltaproteobacteria bacterium]|nr:DUF2167 domain-containing protein [Deltaproteobacteria bacterium]
MLGEEIRFGAILTAALTLAWPAFGQAPEGAAEGVAPVAEPEGEDEDPLSQLPWVTSGKGKLGTRATIAIPEGMRFLAGPEAGKLLEALGNLSDHDELGLIGTPDLSWFVVFFFDDVGFVKDDDKGDLDASKLLKQIQEGVEASNEERTSRGLGKVTLLGWAIPPRYNDKTKTLEWAERFSFAEKDESGKEVSDISVNFKTRVLGRKGVIRIILATEPELLDKVLPDYEKLMAGMEFIEGERYAEWRPGEKVAEYGLVALVAGGAGAVAAKTGLLTAMLVFMKKGWKLLVLAVVGLGSAIKRLFFGGKKE